MTLEQVTELSSIGVAIFILLLLYLRGVCYVPQNNRSGTSTSRFTSFPTAVRERSVSQTNGTLSSGLVLR